MGGNLGRVHYLRLRTSRKEFVHALEDLAECRVVIGRLQQQNDGDDEGELKERKSHEGPDHSGEQPDHPMVAPGIGCVAWTSEIELFSTLSFRPHNRASKDRQHRTWNVSYG
jgi:hypothetical protein